MQTAKKTLFLVSILTLALIPFYKTEAATKKLAYDYELISQSSYPSVLNPGEITNVWIEVKNTGTSTWWNYQDPAYAYHPVRLGTGSKYGATDQQQDYASEFYLGQAECGGTAECVGAPSGWLSLNRPVNASPNVIKPGWHARFQFFIKAPTTPGTYKAYFTPVIEGITWMKDIGIYWEIRVVDQQSACVEEGKNLGPIVPGNNLQCCAGLEPYIPPGAVGDGGICQKPIFQWKNYEGKSSFYDTNYSFKYPSNFTLTTDTEEKFLSQLDLLDETNKVLLAIDIRPMGFEGLVADYDLEISEKMYGDNKATITDYRSKKTGVVDLRFIMFLDGSLSIKQYQLNNIIGQVRVDQILNTLKFTRQ